MKKLGCFSMLLCSLVLAEEMPTAEQKTASIMWDEVTPKAAEQVPVAVPVQPVEIPAPALNTPYPPAPKPPESPVADLQTEEPAKEIAAVSPLPEEDLDAMDEEIDANPGRLPGILIDFRQVFAGSPTIYSVLLFMSVASLGLGLYSLLSLRASQLMPREGSDELKKLLMAGEYEAAAAVCQKRNDLFSKMIGSGLSARQFGSNIIVDTMKSEGKRATSSFWQRLALLNDIAIIAPMLGLLGTVLGMFYAFYDLNRSVESITALFDGLGISVGTTVGGLVVAIIAMVLHSMTKYRLVRQLALVENEANSMTYMMERKEEL
ncbi:MAG: MotA/TolQ/ExbB proton channel family protein [Verrucomicrobia bacterium]|nr:MotA/TolQ/ExbB proton channel family protein [Verrucomicrobiota bacterium]